MIIDNPYRNFDDYENDRTEGAVSQFVRDGRSILSIGG